MIPHRSASPRVPASLGPAVVALALGALGALGCSGGEPPPPPPRPSPPPAIEAPPDPAPEPTPAPDPVLPEPTAAPPAPPPPRVPRTLAVTYAGGCAIHEGRVSCWGQSPRADEDEDPTERPEVQLTGDFVDLAVSDFLACATPPPPGGAQCFGDGADIADDVRALEEEENEENDDWDGEDESSDLDLARDALAGSTDLAMGGAGACVVRRVGDHTVVSCAGEAFEASALDGVRGAERIVEVCVGDDFGCGRSATGQVFCWGDNTVGQLGDGLEDDHAASASRVRGLEGVLHIACGTGHACALRGDGGTVFCWGDNAFGQLARGPDTELSREPLRVEGIEDARAIAVGGDSSCALFDEGPPRCWGANGDGQLGDGSTRSAEHPVEASAVGPVRELALGVRHACAVRGDEATREVVCWGLGDEGALGPRARRRDFAPAEVFAGVTGITRIAAGNESVCVLVGDAPSAEIRCLGVAGSEPREGLDAARVARSVEPARLAAHPRLAPLAEQASGSPSRTFRTARSTCTLEGGRMSCVLSAVAGSAPITEDDVVAAASTSGEVCVVHGTDGSVECASEASGSAVVRFEPVAALPPASLVGHVASARCVVTREDGSVVCLGTRSAWQNGTEPFPPPSQEDAGPRTPGTPAPAAMYRYRDVRDVVQLAGQGSAVRLRDGRILRIAQSSAPVQLLDRAEAILEGSNFACARRVGDTGGEAWCWGLNTRGQLARADTTASAVLIPGLTVPLPEPTEGAPPIDLARHGVVELAVGESNACARLSSGAIRCWGSDLHGQLGRAPAALRLRPVVVLD